MGEKISLPIIQKKEINMNSQRDQVALAIQQAAANGHLTPGSSQTLLANLHGNGIPKTLGVQIPLLESGIPVVTLLVVDETGTMIGFETVVVDGINGAAKDFRKMMEKTGQEIYFGVAVFSVIDGQPNFRVLRDFIHVQDFVDLAYSEYKPNGRTPLNDATFDGITQTMVFGSSAFAYGATGVHEVVAVLTDGLNNESKRTAEEVARFLSELNQKPNFTAAFIGVGAEDFTSVAQSMGFLDGNILPVEKTVGGLAKALKLYSSSVVSKSQQVNTGQKTTSGNFFTNI